MRSVALLGAVTLSAAASFAGSDGPRVKLSGYAEYHRGAAVIVEGQVVTADSETRYDGAAASLGRIPLGYEVEVDGHRQADGSVLAKRVESRPNGDAMFESDVVSATNRIEQAWVNAGEMFMQNGRRRQSIGRILDRGPEVDRVQGILDRLRPDYVAPGDVRVYVVQTDEWNASAMGNGAIWVFTGLLQVMTDDEIAIILGHELAHYTHEHSRRGMKKDMWGQIAGIASAVGVASVDSRAARDMAGLGASLGLSAWMSGYSREMEDQSDRVGLRYAYEAGYDVSKGPELWMKFREKYGEQDSLSNFFGGSHSRPTDRIRNIRRELRRNYRDALE